jgi:KaiC/GvpD/RAD55 family RecA-like ATPase
MHLSPSDTDIYVNVWELAQDLKRAIAQFETDLKAQENLRNTFYEAMRKDRELYVQSNERQKWASALAKAPKAAT